MCVCACAYVRACVRGRACAQVPPTTKFAKWMALHPPQASEENAWGRVTAQSDEAAHELESGEGDGDVAGGSLREAPDVQEGGKEAQSSARESKAAAEVKAWRDGKAEEEEELQTLEGINAYKLREALRIKRLRKEGGIDEDEYNALKQGIKDRCKAAKAAL